MADLPPEILTGILSLLPVQSLLRFRSTSKSLQSLIDSHNFITLHLQNSFNRSLILRHNSDFYQINDFSNLTTAVKLNPPFKGSNNFVSLVGSCNGFLCLFSDGEIAFWNPNIRKHHIIPSLPIPTPQHSEPNNIYADFCVYGFGFDPLTDDYKLLTIFCFVEIQLSTSESHARLFSSKTMGVFVENSLHWIMTEKFDPLKPRVIVAFS